MKAYILTDPTARTRALYAWERDDLDNRPGNCYLVFDERSPQSASKFAGRYWASAPAWNHRRTWAKCPRVEIRKVSDGRSYYWSNGGGHIVLAPPEARAVVLIHELTHARGYWQSNCHSVGFVRAYVCALAALLKWDRTELEAQAMMRRLI